MRGQYEHRLSSWRSWALKHIDWQSVEEWKHSEVESDPWWERISVTLGTKFCGEEGSSIQLESVWSFSNPLKAVHCPIFSQWLIRNLKSSPAVYTAPQYGTLAFVQRHVERREENGDLGMDGYIGGLCRDMRGKEEVMVVRGWMDENQKLMEGNSRDEMCLSSPEVCAYHWVIDNQSQLRMDIQSKKAASFLSDLTRNLETVWKTCFSATSVPLLQSRVIKY